MTWFTTPFVSSYQLKLFSKTDRDSPYTILNYIESDNWGVKKTEIRIFLRTRAPPPTADPMSGYRKNSLQADNSSKKTKDTAIKGNFAEKSRWIQLLHTCTYRMKISV